MKTVKYVGLEEIYSGFDGDEIVNLTPGETATVSDAKAAQLAEDFPYDFEIDGERAAKRPTASAPPEEPSGGSIDELLKLSRKQLDERAAELEISDPAAMENKRDVANAILARVEDAG